MGINRAEIQQMYIVSQLKNQILKEMVKSQAKEIENLRDKIKLQGLDKPDETEKHYKKIHWEDALL
jgi:hypothetical protein